MADSYDELVEAVAAARRKAIQSHEAAEARASVCRPYLAGPRRLLDRLHEAGLIGPPEEAVLTNGLGLKAAVGAGWVSVACSLPRGDGQAMVIVTDSTGMPTLQRAYPAPNSETDALRGSQSGLLNHLVKVISSLISQVPGTGPGPAPARPI